MRDGRWGRGAKDIVSCGHKLFVCVQCLPALIDLMGIGG